MRISMLVVISTAALALSLGCGGDDSDDNGGGGGGSCDGATAMLVGTCEYQDAACSEFRGDRDPADAQSACAYNGGTWVTTECSAAAKANPACVIKFLGGGNSWVVSYGAGINRAGCESDGANCYLAP